MLLYQPPTKNSRATSTELSYDTVKQHLKKVIWKFEFVSANRVPSTYQTRTDRRSILSNTQDNSEVFYGHYRGSRGRKFYNHLRNRSDLRSRGGVSKRSASDGLPKKNPNNPDGSISTCIVCGSVYHWARASPNSYEDTRKQNKSEDDNICDALRDLVPFVQFKKREKHTWRSVTFSKVTPPWVFFTFFKLYKWHQITQRITYCIVMQ